MLLHNFKMKYIYDIIYLCCLIIENGDVRWKN